MLFASRRYGRENAPGGSRASVQKTGACHRHAPVGIRQRPTLPGRFQPSTIGAKRLNFCVRDGNRWIPLAIITGNRIQFVCSFKARALKTTQEKLTSNLLARECLSAGFPLTLALRSFAFSPLFRSSPRPISISKLQRYRSFTADLSPYRL